MEKSKILDIANLSIGYKTKLHTKTVCSNLYGSINGGELVCLLGRNGTGKSTLIRTLCNFQPKLQGDIKIQGKDLKKISEQGLSKLVSVVLTDRISVPNATVYELISLGRSPFTGMFGNLKDHDKKKIKQAAEQCGISHKSNELISSLSDGERQKAFIAKAIAQDTPLIILDEPTAFLDLSARVEIIQLLRHLASKSNRSILLSTHDLDLALQLADKLWLLSTDGELHTGSPEDLMLNNAFQDIFDSENVIFDTKAGTFRVNQNQTKQIAVKGKCFKYSLLQRAFARKGIKAVEFKNNDSPYINIKENLFTLIRQGEIEKTYSSIEKLVYDTEKYKEFLSNSCSTK